MEQQQGMAAAAKPRTTPPGLPFQRAGTTTGDLYMEVDSSSAATEHIVNAHRRSRSDVPFGYYFSQPKAEAGDCNGDDLLFSSYLNLDGLNSSEDSVKAGSSENDSEDRRILLLGDERKEGGVKRTAAGHARSMSMDSLMGKLNFASNGSGEFTPVEMKKIISDGKLAEMALADPKRVKRVLANRQSAARSKERKMQYIVELEKKVQILQTEATTLSAQINLLQRDSAGMATQNNELRFRLQAMEQQAHLRDALNEALTGEVQRLKIATAEIGDTCSSNGLTQQNQMFQLQQQTTPIPFYHLQQQQLNGGGDNHGSSR